MKIDVEKSKYHPRKDVSKDFDRDEVKHLNIVLRRLRFLEQKVRDNGGLAQASNGGAVFDELEIEGLAFVLAEVDFLAPVVDA